MAKMLRCDGISTHSRTWQANPKSWEGSGRNREWNNKVSHTNYLAKFSAAFSCCFHICLSCSSRSNPLTVGRPQPISPEPFFIGNQNTTTKIILFHPCGQIDKRAPNRTAAFMLPAAETYTIFLSRLPSFPCLPSLAHPFPPPGASCPPPPVLNLNCDHSPSTSTTHNAWRASHPITA